MLFDGCFLVLDIGLMDSNDYIFSVGDRLKTYPSCEIKIINKISLQLAVKP